MTEYENIDPATTAVTVSQALRDGWTLGTLEDFCKFAYGSRPFTFPRGVDRNAPAAFNHEAADPTTRADLKTSDGDTVIPNARGLFYELQKVQSVQGLPAMAFRMTPNLIRAILEAATQKGSSP